MITHDVIQALYAYYRPKGYMCLDELKPGTGAIGGYLGGIDFWAMHPWPSERFTRISIEIKVSRSDFLRECRQPEKQDRALRNSNLLYFAAPVGIIPVWDLRSDAGLFEVQPNGTLYEARKAPWRDAEPPSLSFMAAVMRRLDTLRQDEQTKGGLVSAMLLSTKV